MPPPPTDLRSAAILSLVSFVWTLGASSAAVTIGVIDRVLVLIAFGLTGLLDAGGSLTLWLHFRHAVRHEEISAARESLALRFITAGLVTVGILTAIESTRRLVTHSAGHESFVGLALALVSVFVLTGLAIAKRRLAPRVASGALMADGSLSGVGAVLAGITVIGAALAGRDDLWWVDAGAALLVSFIAAAIGVAEFTREGTTNIRSRD